MKTIIEPFRKKSVEPIRMSNTVACVTLDAMGAVCGAHCATWIGEDDKGNREYTLDCLDEDGQRTSSTTRICWEQCASWRCCWVVI